MTAFTLQSENRQKTDKSFEMSIFRFFMVRIRVRFRVRVWVRIRIKPKQRTLNIA